MMRFLGALSRPLLFALDPETAHKATVAALRYAPLPAAPDADARLRTHAFGIDFPNPLGMAAGFDKGAEAPDPLFRAGFGFVEIGTVTPRPQPGNPKPRLFRLVEDEGVINRFGFNSEGHDVVHQRLIARAGCAGILGVNVGANKESADRAGDYVEGVRAFADVATYFTVNISSPNTPGLRDLQQAGVLDDLLARVLGARDEASARYGRRPVLLKIAPDLALEDLDDIVRVCVARGVDGMILGNTTIDRPSALRSKDAPEAGGLSGKPLFEKSTRMLAELYLRADGRFPIVGAGGVHDVASAFAKFEAGATLIQLYSALVFAGPALVTDIVTGLADRLSAERLPSLESVIGRKAQEWTKRGA
jgi:dihydroorotate dehydrogenase